MITDAIFSSDIQLLEEGEEMDSLYEDFEDNDDWQGLNDITLNAYASAAAAISFNRASITELVTEEDAGGISGRDGGDEEEMEEEEERVGEEWTGLLEEGVEEWTGPHGAVHHGAEPELMIFIDDHWVVWPPEDSISAPLERG
jgi:hypothetical protein